MSDVAVYGIDLGTTYSAIAELDEQGMPRIIENFIDSVPLLASAVYFPEGGDPVIGKEAKNQSEIDPSRVVQFIKREIGRPDAQKREFDGVEYDPVMISALILKRMKQYAEEQGKEVKNVVITCPAYFTTEQRMATKQAGEIAGFNVLNIVNEPTAAALNYFVREFPENRKILVYDLGGGTFDVSIVSYSVENGSPLIKVLATDGDDRLGGIDWDQRLYDYICELYTDETGVAQPEMDAELRQIIRAKVEEVKIALTNMASRNVTITYAGDATRISVTREKFEELTADLVARTTGFIQSLLQKADMTVDDIDTVLLVGGSTKMPMIKNAVDAVFPGDGKVRREDPDQAVAKGACLAAGIEWNIVVKKMTEPEPVLPVGPTDDAAAQKAEQERQELIQKYGLVTADDAVDIGTGSTDAPIVLQDILSCSFGPGVFHGNVFMIDNLLFMGDNSPAEATNRYSTMVDNQPGVEIPVYEDVATDRVNTFVTPCFNENGEPQYTDPALKVKKIGEVKFALPAGTPAGSPIEVTFNFSTSGLLVTAINVATGEQFHVQIVSENTKSEAEVRNLTNMLGAMNTTGEIM